MSATTSAVGRMRTESVGGVSRVTSKNDSAKPRPAISATIHRPPNGRSTSRTGATPKSVPGPTAAVVAAVALLVEIVVVLGLAWGDDLTDPAEVSDSFGSPAAIGESFLTDHLLAFEITSIVLLVAAIGGVVLGTTREKDEEVA